ncbi:MAG: bifunctional homocysteine S-methyltransferase/methylenetetrahydrofolate reductase [Desulfuromonadales bacterium]|nr:bifunctional homocysteine S-methyltransferase/methylenetetrahydrofolate reductase [Desulfuromonadales bacterium]
MSLLNFSPRSSEFLERLNTRVIVGDGAMGTLLYSRGVSLDVNFEQLNLRDPQLVRRAHEDYLAAGAQLIETNTFGANRLRLLASGLAEQTVEINRVGAALARQAAGEHRLVAGSVGPLPRLHEDDGETVGDRTQEVLREQMTALADGGIDLFLLETFANLEDLETALAIAHELGLPAVAQLAFLEAGRTRDGVTATAAARSLSAAGAAALGANCGSGPQGIIRVVEDLAAACTLPLSAFPNSGFPQYVDGRNIYLATPEYFAARGRDLVANGVALIGGCCGTTPAHIAALAAAVAALTPVRTQVARPPVERSAVPVAAAPVVPQRNFLAAWGERPVVTVELDPPRGLDCHKVLVGAQLLADAGVDAISIAENPLARIRLGNIALAREIEERCKVETIVHITGRDRNLIGLHADLMGAHLLGLRNILAVTGDPVAVGGEAGATGVFDLNSVGLLELLAALNNGCDLMGNTLGGRTSFQSGAAFNPNPENLAGQLHKLKKKVAAGARYIQTQPVYSMAVLDRLLAATEPFAIPVLVGILPLVSERNAEFLHNEVPGITLPDEIRGRMRGTSGAVGVAMGMSIARELIVAARGRVGGFYLMPPFGRVELALELLTMIRAQQQVG